MLETPEHISLPAAVPGSEPALFLLGINYSLIKGQAWALIDIQREKIKMANDAQTPLELLGTARRFSAAALAFEQVFAGKNIAATLALARLCGQFSLICDMLDIPEVVFPGAHWQRPIKKAFGLRRLPGMSRSAYQRRCCQQFRQYIGLYLEGLSVNHLTDEQIAACAIALHGAKQLKWQKRQAMPAPLPNPKWLN